MAPLLFCLLLDLHGRVLDRSSGQPIAKAQIQAPGKPAVLSGPDGRFQISGLEPGPNSVSIYARGYALSKMRVGKDTYTRRIFWLDEGNQNQEFTAHLTKGARVDGRVVDENRDPIAYGEVMLLEEVEGRWEFAYVVPLSPEGRFEIFGIPPGRFALGTKGQLQILGDLKPGDEKANLEIRIPNAEGFRTEFITKGFGHAVWQATVENLKAPGLPIELLPTVLAYPLRKTLHANLPPGDYLLRVFQKTDLGLHTLVEQPVIIRGQEEPILLAPSAFSPLSLRAVGIPAATRIRIKSLNPSNLTELDIPLEDGETFTLPSLSPGRYQISSQVFLEPQEFTMPAARHHLDLRATAPLQTRQLELSPGHAPVLYRAAEATLPGGKSVEAVVKQGFTAEFRLAPGAWSLRWIE